MYEIASHPNVTLYNQAPWNVLGLWDYKKIERSLWTSLEKHSNKLEWWHDKGWELWIFFLMYSQDDLKLKYNIGPPTSQHILHYIIKMLSKLWIWQIFLFLPLSLFLSHFVFVKIKSKILMIFGYNLSWFVVVLHASDLVIRIQI